MRPNAIRSFLSALILVASARATPAFADGPVDDGLEPPVNPFLADSPWAATHRSSYNQASSPYPAPDGATALAKDQTIGGVGPITIAWSSPYADGRRAVWGATIFDVFKAIPRDGALEVVGRVFDPPSRSLISGSYTVLDKDGNFFVPKGKAIRRYGDVFAGDPDSPIRLLDNIVLSTADVARGDSVVGLTLTYDGRLAFATAKGAVGVLSRDFAEVRTVLLGADEDVSNSIAADEDGGIYVVTSSRMHRVQWTGAEVTTDPAAGAWSAPYDAGPAVPAPGRVGTGSGTTPTLMGTEGLDKFVVIADGNERMNIVLFWRDAIPEDWEPIAPGRDRRIAAEVPITFGDPDAELSVTEQSLTVRGYDAMVVNNAYNWPFTGFLGRLVVFFSGLPEVQPFGVEAFSWNPATRALETKWANPAISCPNGIPTMSAASGLAYCIGARGGVWTLEGIDWETGASAFHAPLGAAGGYNSLYAATEIGPGGAVATGAAKGPLFLTPAP